MVHRTLRRVRELGTVGSLSSHPHTSTGSVKQKIVYGVCGGDRVQRNHAGRRDFLIVHVPLRAPLVGGVRFVLKLPGRNQPVA